MHISQSATTYLDVAEISAWYIEAYTPQGTLNSIGGFVEYTPYPVLEFVNNFKKNEINFIPHVVGIDIYTKFE